MGASVLTDVQFPNTTEKCAKEADVLDVRYSPLI